MKTLGTRGKHVRGIQRHQAVFSCIQRSIVQCALEIDEVPSAVRLTLTLVAHMLTPYKQSCDCSGTFHQEKSFGGFLIQPGKAAR